MNKILLFSLFLFSSSLMAQTWDRKTNIPSARHHPITFSINGIGYSVTGTSSANVPTKDFYDYDPASNSWSTLPLFPGLSRSFGIGTVAPNNLAYIGFGTSSTQFLRDLWSFDASDSSWTRLADCPGSARRHPAMISIGNRIYVGLGDSPTGNLNDWWMYDISTNSWTQTANLPANGRHHPFMFNASGSVYAGLGHGNIGNRGVIYKDWYKLDTASNTWTAMSDFPGEARVAGTQFTAYGYGFVLSGDGDDHSFMQTGEMWRYDPSTDIWTQLPSHPGNSIWAPGSFVINNEVYFLGGLNRRLNFFPKNVYKFMLLDPTGIEEEQEILANTFVYPNPANAEISWKSDISVTDVRIYNSVGQLFQTANAMVGEVDVNNIADGLYFVQFFNKNELVKTSKVLIQH
ncbi:T9SS type A sorting domain-containing protein [Vicingaceae bacterium]|nr:T9SS type A sorting domain-containing protein [Vicingaceae bacterium]